MKFKTIIIIPTLNEVNSIKKLINKINSLKIKKYLLFVDDKSTDGTQQKIKYFSKKNNQYFFLVESLFYLEKLKYKIKEIPIYLSPRIHDNSKMKNRHIINALINLIKLKFKYELYIKKNIKLTNS